jgi:hypothetical protein
MYVCETAARRALKCKSTCYRKWSLKYVFWFIPKLSPGGEAEEDMFQEILYRQ